MASGKASSAEAMLAKATTDARLALLACESSGEEWDALLAEVERELKAMKRDVSAAKVNGNGKLVGSGL